MDTKANTNKELSIILPCHNEEKAIGLCIKQILESEWIDNISTEIVVVDNLSTDKSVEIANEFAKHDTRIRIISESKLGYGTACKKGMRGAVGKYILLCDADGTHDFNDVKLFINKMKDGFQLVIGNRFAGKMESGAMSRIRKIGNPIFSLLAKWLFKTPISDIHCGMRCIRKDFFNHLPLLTNGMEFASEMIIKSVRRNGKICEVPVRYKKRIGQSKLEAVNDGWRHLRFFLLFSPFALFFIPSVILLILGLASGIIFYFSGFGFLSPSSGIHPLFISSLLLITGYQLLFFSAFSKIYAITHLSEKNKHFERLFKFITIEKVGSIGIFMGIGGIIIFSYILFQWIKNDFGDLKELKNAIIALTATIIGIQTFFSAFMLSILSIRESE